MDHPNNRRSDVNGGGGGGHYYRTADRRSTVSTNDVDYDYDGDDDYAGYGEGLSADYEIPAPQAPPPPPAPPSGYYGQTFNWDGLQAGKEEATAKTEEAWPWKRTEQDLTGGTLASGSGGGIQVLSKTFNLAPLKNDSSFSVLRTAERLRPLGLLLLQLGDWHRAERQRGQPEQQQQRSGGGGGLWRRHHPAGHPRRLHPGHPRLQEANPGLHTQLQERRHRTGDDDNHGAFVHRSNAKVSI